jgi:aquaporin Z
MASAPAPRGYGSTAALVTEVLLTFVFLLVILGTTDRLAPSGFAGVPIGLSLTLIHLISIPVTNTSVNPARSTGVALWVGGAARGATLAVLAGAHRGGPAQPAWLYGRVLQSEPRIGEEP